VTDSLVNNDKRKIQKTAGIISIVNYSIRVAVFLPLAILAILEFGVISGFPLVFSALAIPAATSLGWAQRFLRGKLIGVGQFNASVVINIVFHLIAMSVLFILTLNTAPFPLTRLFSILAIFFLALPAPVAVDFIIKNLLGQYEAIIKKENEEQNKTTTVLDGFNGGFSPQPFQQFSQVTGRYCPKCNYTISLNACFCCACGEVVGKNCAGCGATVRVGEMFCGACGVRMIE